MKEEVENAIRISFQYISKERERNYREAYSIFFWGLTDHFSFKRRFSPRIGDVFCRAVILDVLIDLYERGIIKKSVVSSDLETLISKRDRRGWKYYPDSEALPEDADDTGLLLESMVRMGYNRVCCSSIAALLVENILEDGAIFTWLLDPEEREKAGKRWGGGISPAVTATAAYSIYLADPVRYRKPLQKTNLWLREKVVSGKIEPVWYVSPLYTLYRITRFLNLYSSLSNDMKEIIISLNIPDPHSVTDVSYALLTQKILKVDLTKDFIYTIMESQRPDGSFEKEYFHYYMPPDTPNINVDVLKKYQPDFLFYSSVTITTAIALKALTSIRDIIE